MERGQYALQKGIGLTNFIKSGTNYSWFKSAHNFQNLKYYEKRKWYTQIVSLNYKFAHSILQKIYHIHLSISNI